MSNSVVDSITVNVMSNSTGTLWRRTSTIGYKPFQACSFFVGVGPSIFDLVALRFFCGSDYSHTDFITLVSLLRNKCVQLHVQGKIISLELHIFWLFCYFAICFTVVYVLEVTSSVSSPLSLSFLHAVLLKSRAHIRLGAMIPPLSCTIYVVLNLPHRVVL